MTIPTVIGVNPLQTTLLELGIVSGRVALLLRSAEIQPVFLRFVRWTLSIPPPPPLVPVCYWVVSVWGAAAAEGEAPKSKLRRRLPGGLF